MSKFELKLPKMGESVAEATITSWLKEIGDQIEMDEAVLEIATDKVDTEVPCEFEGVLIEKCFNVEDVVQVGQTIAIIETEAQEATPVVSTPEVAPESVVAIEEIIEKAVATVSEPVNFSSSDKFFSPLVKNIAKKENITQEDLNSISGSGKDGRVTKQDILNYIGSKPSKSSDSFVSNSKPLVGDQIIELDRMGKIIFDHMSNSKKKIV